MVGTLAGAAIGTACTKVVEEAPPIVVEPGYGRTPDEKKRDEKLQADMFLNTHELETIAVLCDIILPATNTVGSATDAGVPEFIEFIAKDIPKHQLPLRGGLMWLDTESNKRFNLVFKLCTNQQQITIVDDIAYDDPDGKKLAMTYGIKFFSLMRGLTLTGYYTTRMGVDDLGYVGNSPNIWDGVPQDVLKDYDVDYDPEWLAKCVDQSKRDAIAEWDEDGNLIT